MEMSIPAFVNEVVATTIPDEPGSLSIIMLPLLKAGIRIETMYAYIGASVKSAVMIFRFSDNDKAIDVLQENGLRILDATIFDILE